MQRGAGPRARAAQPPPRPASSDWPAFVTTVVERQIATILQARKPKKRLGEGLHVSLSDETRDAGGLLRLGVRGGLHCGLRVDGGLLRGLRGDDRPGIKKAEPAQAGRGGKVGVRKGTPGGGRGGMDNKFEPPRGDRGGAGVREPGRKSAP